MVPSILFKDSIFSEWDFTIMSLFAQAIVLNFNWREELHVRRGTTWGYIASRLFRVRLFRIRHFRVSLFRIHLFRVCLFRIRLSRVGLFRVGLFLEVSVFAYSVFAYSVFGYFAFAYSVRDGRYMSISTPELLQ